MGKESKKGIDLHKKHRERMRKRFLEVGFDGFEDHEILELLLFYSIPRINTNETAHRLIYKFGSIKNILNAPISELKSVEGIGENSVVFLKVLDALLKEDLMARKNDDALTTSERVGAFIMPHFSDLSVENFVVIALDSALKPIAVKNFGDGSSKSVNVAPAKIVKFLINCDAYGAIVAHNHPGGLAVPSIADIRSTGSLKTVLNSIGIKLIDHLIMVSDDFVSVRDSGDNIYMTM